ncbi:MAG: 3'-5' exonuclease [Bacteroidales bacterium]|nr:3'-5' exonuclease [Bacteroidales bacterium]
MLNFAAIDFETANYYPTSACSIGVVIVKDGKMVDSYYHLIHPRPNYYNPKFIEIHGITPQDTENEPDFPEVWSEIVPKIAGLPLVAHNSPFDSGVLKKLHEFYHLTYPNYPFYCTLRASQKELKNLSNHQLHTVAAYFGYDLVNHHHALADAEACAIIARELL